MADSTSSSTHLELPNISSLDDLPSSPLPTPVTTAPQATLTEAVDVGVTIVPSSKRPMRHQSSGALANTPKKKGSMDSLIDHSLRAATPSPSKGKSKIVEPHPAASTLDVQPPLPDYLVPPPSKKETVDAASKRADANLSLMDSKIDGVQALLSEEIKGIRTHLAQLAADLRPKEAPQQDLGSHSTIANLITSHNKVVETVHDLSGHVASLSASTMATNACLTSLEAAPPVSEPTHVPAEKRLKYDEAPVSTLVPLPPPIHSEMPHAGGFAPAYPTLPTIAFPAANTQPIPNPPTQAARNTKHRQRTVQLGPMNWANYRDEVHALLNMVPAFNAINKGAIRVAPSQFAHHARITFGSSSDATTFSRIWNSSRPQQFSMVSVSYVAEN